MCWLRELKMMTLLSCQLSQEREYCRLQIVKNQRKTTFGIPKVEYPYKRIDNAKYSLNAMIGISFVYEE